MEAQIKDDFNKAGFTICEDDERVLNKCLTFCINFKLSPSDLVSSWEVYYLNRQLNDSRVQDVEMDGFLLHLQNEQKEAFLKEETNLHVYSSSDVDMILNVEKENTMDATPDTHRNQPATHHDDSPCFTTPANGRILSSMKTSSVMTPFGQRTNKFSVHFEFNKLAGENKTRLDQDTELSDDDIISKAEPGKRCSLAIQGSSPAPNCRFMYDRIEDKFDFLEQHIKRQASALVTCGNYEEPVDPTVASPQRILAVGMIFCDGEGHLNENSVLLQSSVEHSGGQRVRLDLGKVGHYSIFPGQVVGVVGNNPSGHCLTASEIVDSIPFPIYTHENPHPVKRQALESGPISMGLSGAQAELSMLEQRPSMIIAAGPFTTTDNLLFEPLKELLAHATRKQPQLLMLLGPFVDSEHPEIKKLTFDRSFDEVFDQEIIRRLQDHVEFMGTSTRVILVPSIRDANHDFVFPQPPFEISSPELKHQITSIGNPGVFDANQAKISCCTIDILKHLSGEEISRHPENKDRLGRLATHIISQHSFYPLYPPVEGVPLDLSIAPEVLDIISPPNILILPSDLSPFVKIISSKGKDESEQQDNCVCVNPGRLAKGVGGGTFVELNYHESPETTEAYIIRI